MWSTSFSAVAANNGFNVIDSSWPNWRYSVTWVTFCVSNKLTYRTCIRETTYYGKTIRIPYLHTRVCEHAGVSHLTGKVSKCHEPSAVFEHFLDCPVNVRVLVENEPLISITLGPKLSDFTVLLLCFI